MAELKTTDALALRQDMAGLKEAIEKLTSVMLAAPETITEKLLVNITANMASMKDDLTKVMSEAKPAARKRGTTTAAPVESKKSDATSFTKHPNFPHLTMSAWGKGSVKVFTSQMLSHDEEYIGNIIPDGILNAVKNLDAVKEGLNDKKTNTPHKKAQLIAHHLWKYLETIKRKDEVERIIAAERAAQNTIRLSGSVTRVPTENITKEEEDAGAADGNMSSDNDDDDEDES